MDTEELRSKTAWTPLQGGGWTIRTHELRFTGADRVELAPSFVVKLIWACLIALALSPLSMIVIYQYSDPLRLGLVFGSTAFLLFLCIGAAMQLGKRPVFDRGTDRFYVRRASRRENETPLSTIAAIQILTELVSEDDDFSSHELNLILDDGSRRPVIDHSDIDALRADAERLAAWLEVPVLSSADRS